MRNQKLIKLKRDFDQDKESRIRKLINGTEIQRRLQIGKLSCM